MDWQETVPQNPEIQYFSVGHVLAQNMESKREVQSFDLLSDELVVPGYLYARSPWEEPGAHERTM